MKEKFYAWFVSFALLAALDHAAAGSVMLNWDASSSPGVAGYNVYYGTTNGAFTGKITAGNVTMAAISNLCAGVTYYFATTAVGTNGDESAFSNVAGFIIPGVLTLSRGTNPGTPAVISFPVEPGHWYEVQATTNLTSWTTVWQTGVSTSNNWVQFTDPDTGAFSSRYYRLALH
jgi:hypothetical protein